MRLSLSAKNNTGINKYKSAAIKGRHSPLYFYLTGIILASLFIVPAATIQTFYILDSSIIADGKFQWSLFIMPVAVITVAGLMIGRIKLLSDMIEQSSQQQQRELLNNTSSLAYMKDMDGRYLFINRRFETLFHITEQEIIGKTDYDILPKEKADSFRKNDRMAVEAGKPLEFDETVTQDDGEHTYISVKFPLKDASGEIYATCGISTDITERITMEEALRRSQKMEAIGQLTGGIAHDFNNQLGVIIGYLDFLKRYVANDEKPLRWIETASLATQHCVDLTQQLLSFSRSKTKQTTVVNVNEAIKDMDNMLSHSITPEVEIQYSLAEPLWSVETDLGELKDVILNLVINARDAMPNGGKLIIRTRNINIDSDNASLHPEVKAGDYVEIEFSDNGVGMDKKTQEHVYEPFFTTKPEGKGTGLGLSMVYGFVERYEGYINVESEPGLGSSFCFYLPRCDAANVALKTSDDDTSQLTGSSSILVVDDEVELLQLAREYLLDLGYSVFTTENAAEALEILSQENIDLLFSDVVMPGGMNGYELAQQATQIQPQLKVLLTSGFAAKSIAQNDLQKFSENLLSKPYRRDDLAKRIRLVLDKQTEPSH